jgi:YVTN family beta-propeller protein
MHSSALVRTFSAALLALSSCATSNPRESAGTLVVLNKSDASASLIDPGSRVARTTASTGVGPHEVAVSPDGAFAVVADYGEQQPGSTLTVIDLAGNAPPRKIDLGEPRRPHGIEFEDARHVIVTAEQSRAILRVDVAEGRLVDVFPTQQNVSHMVVLTPDGERAFVANIGSSSVTVIDLASGQVVKQVSTGAGSEGIAITPDGREVWVGNRAGDTLSVIDARSLEVVATLPCAKFPIRIKITPDGEHALVSCAQSGDVAVFDVAKRVELRRISMAIDAVANTADRLLEFGDSPVPVGVLIRPDGKRAYVANTNADLVTELDLETWSIVARIPTGTQPDGLGWSALGGAAQL